MKKDPYRYFRIEAQELSEGLAEGLLELAAGPDREVVRRLLRHAHTLKGASRVVKEVAIGDLAHEIEDLLSPHRETGRVAEEVIDRALALLDRIRGLVALLGRGPAAAGGGPQPESPAEDERSVRIDIADLDGLLESALEAHTAARSLGRELERLGELRAAAEDALARWAAEGQAERLATEMQGFVERLSEAQRRMHERLDGIAGELAELRAAASELRLVPATLLTHDLERLVRDDARALNKEVELVCTGADTHIDAHVLAGLRKALVHVVRNSVAHGIEEPIARQQAGKPRRGRIELGIERRGGRVAIRCRDDGRGLDFESVRRAAVERGAVGPEAARGMDERALGRLLLQGGLSTEALVTRVSGRGVGLDAVRDAIEALEGEVSLSCDPGRGTAVDMLVPISLMSMPALSLAVDDLALLIPLDSVRQTLRVRPEELVHGGGREHIVFEDNVIPLFSLARALERQTAAKPGAVCAVVVEAEGRVAAVSADRLGGVRSVVMRAIPAHAAAAPVIAGAALDDEGRHELVLAPPLLVRLAREAPPVGEEVPAKETLPILVVDDSLTTRMLEQSILESAGYDVDLAVSGADALEKAAVRRYGLFVVDVEMPGMSGFELLERCREDPRFCDIPAIMVTSRDDEVDRRRGLAAGARAYIVKADFDQVALLETIRGLL